MFNIFNKKPANQRAAGPLRCSVCGREGLKLPSEISDGKMDGAARECVRCGSVICVFCLKELPKAPDGFGSLCPSCNQYSIFELAGKPDGQVRLLQKDAEKMYGTRRI